MAEVSCDMEGVEVMGKLLQRGGFLPWVSTLNDDQNTMLCKMLHNLVEKQASTVFIVAQIKQDFGIDVSVEHVEDLKDRFIAMYNITLRERN